MQQIRFFELKRKDHARAISMAVEGMHFDVYLKNKIALAMYGRYFLYSELNRATQVIAAYQGERLVGVLLAEIYGERALHSTLWTRLFASFVDGMQRLFFASGVGPYDEANEEIFAAYCMNNRPDGQIAFLAADPDCGIKGIGSMLLAELERRVEGKTLFLYTDENCSYKFYEHRGFERLGEKNIIMELEGRKLPLTCMLYSKTIKGEIQ